MLFDGVEGVGEGLIDRAVAWPAPERSATPTLNRGRNLVLSCRRHAERRESGLRFQQYC